MKIDQLFQFLVPLAFLAIWALTSLFNRAAHPLPPRTGRPPDPTGPKPSDPSPTMRPVERRAEPPPRDPTLRWSSPRAEPSAARRPPARPDDEIVILESETRRPVTPPRPSPGAGTSPRRAARAKPATTASPKRPEPSSPRALSGSGTSPMTSQLTRSMEVKPLMHATSSPLTNVEASSASKATPIRPVSQDATHSSDFRPSMVSPEKIREGIIMSELLQLPLALRPRRRRGI
jgi:hypothetical protein